MDELERRCQILIEYAKWTALSAVRSGGPIKATEPIYQLLDGVAFPEVLDPSLELISCEDFDRWHRAQTEDLCARATPMLPTNPARAGLTKRMPSASTTTMKTRRTGRGLSPSTWL